MPSGITSQLKIINLFYVVFFLFAILATGMTLALKIIILNEFTFSFFSKTSVTLTIVLIILVFSLEIIIRKFVFVRNEKNIVFKIQHFARLYIIRIAFYIFTILISDIAYMLNNMLIMFLVTLIISLGVFLNKPGIKIITRDINLTISEKKQLIGTIQ
jgi:hypothetical protein